MPWVGLRANDTGLTPASCVQPGVVDLWSIHLPEKGVRIATRDGIDALADEDHQAAQRLRNEDLRTQFLAGRRAQRCILSRYAAQPPQDLQLDRSGGGKPVLGEHPHLHFSFSRRGSHAFLAVAAVPVGVDLERHRADWNSVELMRVIGSQAEQRIVDALPAAAQAEAVMRCWTAKEACVKAAGWGLALAPNSFDVGPLVGDASASSWALSLPALRPGEPMAWSVQTLEMATGWSAALAVPAQVAGARIARKFWLD